MLCRNFIVLSLVRYTLEFKQQYTPWAYIGTFFYNLSFMNQRVERLFRYTRTGKLLQEMEIVKYKFVFLLS